MVNNLRVNRLRLLFVATFALVANTSFLSSFTSATVGNLSENMLDEASREIFGIHKPVRDCSLTQEQKDNALVVPSTANLNIAKINNDYNGILVESGGLARIFLDNFHIKKFVGATSGASGASAFDGAICVEKGATLTLIGEGYVDGLVWNFGNFDTELRGVTMTGIVNMGNAHIDDAVIYGEGIINGAPEANLPLDTVSSMVIRGGDYRQADIILNSKSAKMDIKGGNYPALGMNFSDLNIHDGDFSQTQILANIGKTHLSGGTFGNTNMGFSVVNAVSNGAAKPLLIIDGGSFNSPEQSSSNNPESVLGSCVDLGKGTESTECTTQISGGIYHNFIPDPNFYVEGYDKVEIAKNTVAIKKVNSKPEVKPQPETKPSQPEQLPNADEGETTVNPNTADSVDETRRIFTVSALTGLALIFFLKRRR